MTEGLSVGATCRKRRVVRDIGKMGDISAGDKPPPYGTRITQSLPPGGRWRAKHDGGSPRNFEDSNHPSFRILPQSPAVTAPSRRGPHITPLQGIIIVRRGGVSPPAISKKEGDICGNTPSPSASPPPVSLRLGHTRGLTTHRVVIQDPRAASLPNGGGLPRLSLWENSREAGERAHTRRLRTEPTNPKIPVITSMPPNRRRRMEGSNTRAR